MIDFEPVMWTLGPRIQVYTWLGEWIVKEFAANNVCMRWEKVASKEVAFALCRELFAAHEREAPAARPGVTQ